MLCLQEREIASAAEGFAGAGEHHATGSGVALQVTPDIQQLVVQGRVDDVVSIWAVDRDDPYRAIRCHAKFVAHIGLHY